MTLHWWFLSVDETATLRYGNLGFHGAWERYKKQAAKKQQNQWHWPHWFSIDSADPIDSKQKHKILGSDFYIPSRKNQYRRMTFKRFG